MAEQFLSCDGNFINMPKDNYKKKESPNTMISISTISASLSTDDSSLLRRKAPQPKICCFIPVNTASIFAITFTSILTLSMYIYLIVKVVQHPDPEIHREKIILLLSVVTCIVLIFTALFVWGIFGKRPGFLLPNIALSAFLLFALIGICIFSFLTAADEVKHETEKKDSNVVNLFLLRAIIVILVFLESIFLYIFIKSYLYLRRVVREK